MAITDDLAVKRVLQTAKTIPVDRDKVITWLQEPLPTFDGKTALELIAEGRADAVLRYLASIASGVVG